MAARFVRKGPNLRTFTTGSGRKRPLPRSMIPVHQKPAGVVKFDKRIEKAKTRVFWGAWVVLAGGSVLSLGSYLLAGPQALMDSAFRKVKLEPVVARKLGTPLHAFGQGCECRRARQQVAIEEYRDRYNRAIARTTFYVEGPRGRGIVDARVLNNGLEHSVLRRITRSSKYTSLKVRFPDGSVHTVV
mmetsp:Transcript_7872/g.12793  ORF Transcript_7872/g.12793 Transcript_7872/m.12793 type:complete len:187 (-) Transcript_7872:197-757(-)